MPPPLSASPSGKSTRPVYPAGGRSVLGDPDLIPVDPAQRESIQVLVVDDDRSLRESCASLLTGQGHPVTVCGRGDDALRMVRGDRFDILLLDLYMKEATGFDIMKAALDAQPDVLVVMMTGNPSVETSVKALREGAWDYLPKPFSATHFEILMGRAAHAVVVARESSRDSAAPSQSGGQFDRTGLVGNHPAFLDVVDVASKVARTDASVFITGESGVGKEVIAQYIHRNSRRRSRELVAVNCAAIPEALVESEMFGHVEGAFTGAVKEKQGLLEVAHGGTLFLDELTALPLPTQAKLLRVLQDGVIRRVGSTKTDAVVNVRFIAATNEDPQEALAEGRLRRDLHYRLRVVPIHVPPLRERREDIARFAQRFLEEFWALHRGNDSAMPTFSGDALEALDRAPWSGNVRELRNVIEHLVVLTPAGSVIEPEYLPFMDDDLASETPDAGYAPSVMALEYHDARERVLGHFENAYLRYVVQEAEGNISDAARRAGVDRTTLYRLMEKHGTGRRSLILDETG